MRRAARVRAFAAVACCVAAIVAVAGDARAQTPATPRDHRPFERGQDLARQAGEIRRTRAVVKRILRDRRASDELKKQATELEALLDQREQIIERLQTRQKEFAAQHQAEIDELDDLRRRARDLDERLGAARKTVLDSSKDDVKTLKDVTSHAADLADGLRTRYFDERRAGRGRARNAPETP